MNKPTERLETSETLKKATKASSSLKTNFTNTDLPRECLPLWNELYVQLLHDWAGTLPNPWSCYDANIQENLQALWDRAYPDIKANIQPKQAIFVRVCVAFRFFQGISDISVFRVLKKSQNGVAVLGRVPLLPSKMSGSCLASRLQKDERSMRTTCLAPNSHLRTSVLILRNKFVVALGHWHSIFLMIH